MRGLKVLFVVRFVYERCVWQTWQRPTLPRLETKYHWRRGVSRPSSEWDRVQPPRCNHQVSKAQRSRMLGFSGACDTNEKLGFVSVLRVFRAWRPVEPLGRPKAVAERAPRLALPSQGGVRA